MKKYTISIILCSLSLFLITGCKQNIPETVPTLNNTFNETPDLRDTYIVDDETNYTKDKIVYSVKDGYQILGHDKYGYLELPEGYYSYFEKEESDDFMSFTDGSGRRISMYPFKRAEMAGDAELMVDIYSESLTSRGYILQEKNEVKLLDSSAYSASFKVPYEVKDENGETVIKYSSAKLFFINEKIADGTIEKDIVKYIFAESPLEVDNDFYSMIETYSLNGYAKGTHFPANIDSETTQTLFNNDITKENINKDDYVELQNKKHKIVVFSPDNYQIVNQDKFSGKFQNEKYYVSVALLDDSEVDYIRKTALSEYEYYKNKYIDYSDVDITNETTKDKNEKAVAHYIVKYTYNELNQKYEHHYYAYRLDEGIYVIDVQNGKDNNFKDFNLDNFINFKIIK